MEKGDTGPDPRRGPRRRAGELAAGEGIRADVAVARVWRAAPGAVTRPGVTLDPVM